MLLTSSDAMHMIPTSVRMDKMDKSRTGRHLMVQADAPALYL